MPCLKCYTVLVYGVQCKLSVYRIFSYKYSQQGCLLCQKRKKRKLLCCHEVEFLEVVSVGQIFGFFFNYFKNHPKVQHLGAFSTIFLKKHPIWAKMVAFPTVILKTILTRVGRWGQHNIFFMAWLFILTPTNHILIWRIIFELRAFSIVKNSPTQGIIVLLGAFKKKKKSECHIPKCNWICTIAVT